MKLRLALSIALFAILPRPAPAEDAAALPPAARWIPAQAVAALEIVRPEAILDPLLSPATEAFVTSFPGWKERTEDPGFRRLAGAVQMLEARLGVDWKTALRKLFRGGAAWAVGPSGESLLVIDAESPQILADLHDFALGLARAEAAKENAPGRVSSEERGGVVTWTLGPEEFHAIVGNRLLLSNRRPVLELALDLRAGAGAGTLDDLPAYKASRAAAPEGAAATLFVNLERVREAPGVRESLARGREPMGALLFGRVLESLRSSSWLSAALLVGGNGVAIEAALDAPSPSGSGVAAFAAPPSGAAAAPNLAVPRAIAAWTLWRDLAGFYAKKDDLFPERTSGLIFFENMMGIFFSGMHLADEVFAELGPEIRAVVAAQEYDPEVGEPEIRLPAFAFIFRMKDPAKFAPIAEEAWQKAIGLINFTRGQQALPGMILGKRSHAGREFTVAAFRPPSEKGPLDVRFNFSPSIAVAGDSLVFSSTAGLAKDVIAALEGGPTVPSPSAPGTDSLLEIRGRPLRDLLEANRANLVRQNMVEKGHSEAEAEREIGLLLELAGRVRSLRLSSAVPEGRTKARVELEIEP